MLPVEVRYLDVVWSDPETVLKLEWSREALELEQTASGWLVETTTFPSMHHYIGICIKDSHVKHAPYFELADGNRQKLIPLKVPGTDNIWWIQNSGWDPKAQRYFSELYRTAGRAELTVQNQRLIIENNTFNFTVSELEYYLADFKNSLWMLILDDNSIAKGSVNKEVPDCFNDEVITLFHDFIQSVEKIIKKPGMVLTEYQGKLPFRAVRPVPRTFREYATQPNAKFLTSRAYRESYDTAENRYIHYCVKRVAYILKSLSRVATAQARSYTNKIEQEQEWGEQLQQSDTKQVDSRVYDNEIAKIKGDLSSLEQSLSGIVSGRQSVWISESGEIGSYTLELGDNYRKSSNEFFVKKLNGDFCLDCFGTHVVAIFPYCIGSALSEHVKQRYSLVFSGRYKKSKDYTSNGKMYYRIEFLEVTSITLGNHPLKSELSKLIENRKKLEHVNWIVPLTSEEQQERRVENDVAMRKTAFYESLLQQMTEFYSSIPTLQARLVKVLNFFKEHKVKVRSDCPNTMVFIQNPAYASAKIQFRKISALNGLDEYMLNSLMAVDEIGLVNVANLYEKWCLLQIIKVLHQIYGFEIEAGWQRTLIDAVLVNGFDVEIRFEAPERQHKVVLTYEKVLDSGKRPDFVIDLTSKEYEVDQHDPARWIFTGEISNRIVLDAKFRGEITEHQLHKLVASLYETKNYSEDGTNQVFVIHPSQNVIENRTSPLVWGSQCDYGQSNNKKHRYGGVFVSPSLTHARSLEHLQRLIGLFLQKNSIILSQPGFYASSWHNMCCISCGNANHQTLRLVYKPTKAGSDRWVIGCGSCGLLTVKTICRDCHCSLFKNGPKWTYHRTRAEQTSNVVCPKCETFL